jgi:hypothetical protein
MAQQPIVGPKLIVSSAITEANTNTTVNAIEIPAGVFVPPYGVSIYIPEVFAGGTPSLDVGDSGNPDGWIDTTEITETTIGMYSGVAAALAVTGKYYAASDFIQVVVSASLTGGTAYVIARFYDFNDLSVAAA